MEASTVSSAEAVPRARARTARKPKKDRTPWYMWVAVAAIVLFCLFPFYWLINISLKAGQRPPRLEHRPTPPDAD
jgi:ABC-type sugar transport system, permease component